MAKVKRSVSLEEDLVAEAAQLRRYGSLSEATNAGLQLVVAQARLDELIAEHEDERGEVPAALVEEVERWLTG